MPNEISLAVILEILSRGSAIGAAVLVVWALMTERLVPKGRLDDCIKSRERLIEQRDKLIKERNSLIEQRNTVVEQRDKLTKQRDTRRHAKESK